MYRFTRRTAEPLEPLSAPGCDKPTSRCQIIPSIGTLKNCKPVIPSVPFICWSIICPLSIIGSLWPTFISVRLIRSYSQAKYIPLHSKKNKNFFEFAIVHPRYILEGDRPSQTDTYTHITHWELSIILFSRVIFHLLSINRLVSTHSRFSPKLHKKKIKTMYNYSKGAWGLSV